MKKAGKAVSVLMAAVLTAGITSPAVFAASAPYVQSDTTIDFTVPKSNTYAFKFTIHGSHSCPNIVAGNGAVLRTENTVKRVENGNDVYYFKVRAIGNIGQSSAIYTTLPGQKAVKHCTIKVGIQHHKSYEAKNGGFVDYYEGTDTNSVDAFGYYKINYTLGANRKKQYFIDYMSYMGYTHNASLDNANIWTTPTAEQYKQSSTGDCDTSVEKGLEASANDLIEELKKHKTTEYGVHTVPNDSNKDYNTEQIIPTFQSNLTYDTNPDPVFTSKYYQGFYNLHATAEGGNMGCEQYVTGRAKEITGITLADLTVIEAYVDDKNTYSQNLNKIKAWGYELQSTPKKDAIAYEPGASALGHWEYVEAVNGDNVTLSGGNGKYEPGDGLYYGRVTRTKSTLASWNTVYVYLK
jgi:hypothetical protein